MLDKIFDGSMMPHGHCLLWREDLLFMTLVGDGLTVLSYGLIPLALIYIVKKRTDLEFDRIFLLFAAFIAFCGLSHAVSMVNIWHGYYFIQGAVKLATGLVSILTAFMLWRLMPSILAIPSVETLSLQNKQLLDTQQELEKINHSLEDKVKERTESLEKLANTDQLTQVKNRRAILQILEDEFKRVERHPHNLSLLMLDIDHFKQVNDTYGHLEGDNILIEVANIINTSSRNIDAVGRYGGEEFLIMLPETDISAATAAAEKIRLAVSECKTKSGTQITCSIGIASLGDNETLLELINKADERVYKAKELGRNQVVSK